MNTKQSVTEAIDPSLEIPLTLSGSLTSCGHAIWKAAARAADKRIKQIQSATSEKVAEAKRMQALAESELGRTVVTLGIANRRIEELELELKNKDTKK